MDKIWNYYRDAAISAGRNSETGKSLPFSLEFFFCNTRPQDQNELVRTFLGDGSVRLRQTPPPPADEIRRYTSQVTPLYGSQLEAISKALSYPISLVQGPPGTGKTEMILSLISVLLHLRPGASIAVVSTNNEAITNIIDKIRGEKGNDPMLAEIDEKFAVLGRRQNIRDWRELCAGRGEDTGAIHPDTLKIDSAYLRRYPVFSSTVHSLRKIFLSDEAFRQQFDYVIADECSQMSVMLGIVAMSCAKNLVLIGDNRQLPPVISQKIQTVSSRHPGLPDFYKEAEGKSFLSLCEELFPDAPKSFLDNHYRCHPSIIEFCNRYVYDGRLAVKTKDDGQFRIRAVWYEGDYCEKIREPEDGEPDAQVRRKIYNQRQIEIFLREELPLLAEKLRNPKFSAAVISPFRRQIELLGQRLREALDAMDLGGSDVTETLDEDDIPRLTIHKAQGKGFDAVYLLPVEDYYTRNPWSQRKRLINVAVSRAKQEFCIITSSQWLPEALQKELTGYVLPNGEETEPDEEGMYCRKLLRYAADKCPEPQGRFGFHRSQITSVFDQVPLLRQRVPASGQSLSAPARCMENALLRHFGDRYTVLRELPLRDIEQTEAVRCTDPDLLQYLRNSRVDFALCEGNRVRLLIEVDGAFHRDYLPEYQENDEDKNTWIRELLQAGDLFMRIPTDGTTDNEIEAIEARLEGASTLLTISDGAASRAGTAAQAQDAAELLLAQLESKVDGSLAVLRELFSRPGLSEAAKIRAVAMNYTWAENMTYRNHLRNSFYLCRYAVAYAFEYAMLYDLALRLCFESGSRTFGAFSFGAGSLLDAWSLAYAKARLTVENPACGEIRLYYKGVDEQAWGSYFVNPSRVYSGQDFTLHPADSPLDEQTGALFEKVWLYNWDINRFLLEDILQRPQKNFYYNTLVFPKIINELSDGDVENMVEALEQCRFSYDEYYLLVSHSAYQKEKSAEILGRLVRAMNPDGAYEVSSSLEELLSPDSRRAFERAWLGEDRLVPLAGAADPFQCYAFASAAGERDALERGAYIDQHNSAFTYDGPKEFLSALDGKDGLRAQQVRTVGHIVFDAVRLKKREE